MGDVLREWNKLDAAEDYLAQGMHHLRGTLSVDAEEVMLGFTTLARLKLARGDFSVALVMLDEFEHIARRRNFVAHLRARGFAVRAKVDLAQGSLAAATHWADTCGLSTQDDLSYLHEREYLTLARVLIAQARNDLDRRSLQNALHLLKRLLHDAEIKTRMNSAIEILVLRALASQALGDSMEALVALKRAVVLGESEGYVRIFLDEGEAMLHLLSRLLAIGYGASAYIQTLLAAGAKHMHEPATSLFKSKEPHSRSSQPLLDPLSERELEVLYLVANGDSNCKIAEQFFVAVSTVKRHVSNTFSKLGVTNRTQAVARARIWDLIIAGILLHCSTCDVEQTDHISLGFVPGSDCSGRR